MLLVTCKQRTSSGCPRQHSSVDFGVNFKTHSKDQPAFLHLVHMVVVVVHEYHVSRLLVHLSSSNAHGHLVNDNCLNPPNVCLLQGWRVIDSISSDSNHIAGPLISLDDEQLLLGALFGKGDHLVVDDDLVQLVLGPLCHHVARDAGCSCLWPPAYKGDEIKGKKTTRDADLLEDRLHRELDGLQSP